MSNLEKKLDVAISDLSALPGSDALRHTGKRRHGKGDLGPREAAAFIKGKTVGAKVRFLAEDNVPRLGTVAQVGEPGWFLIRSDTTGVYHNIHVASILNIIKPAPRGGDLRSAARR